MLTHFYQQLGDYLKPGRVLIIYGPRRVGKTTLLEHFLIFGSYPEVILTETRKDKMELLLELVDSYLLRDILALERVKGADVLLKLVKLLAFQIGQLVSISGTCSRG